MDLAYKGLNESTEEVNREVFFFSGRSRGLFFLLLFLLLGLLLLLLLLGGSGSGSRSGSRCTERYFGQSFADELINLFSANSLEDCIDLSLIERLSGGLEDGNNGFFS